MPLPSVELLLDAALDVTSLHSVPETGGLVPAEIKRSFD